MEIIEWLLSTKVKCDMNHICIYAAKHNSRSVLEWAVNRGTLLTPNHLTHAVARGHLVLVRWMHEEQHVPFDDHIAYVMADSGNLSLLQYVVEKGAEPDDFTLPAAAKNGSEAMVRWLHDKRGLGWSPNICEEAAKGGRISLIQYLHAHGCAWDFVTTESAASNGHMSLLRWALENGCQFGCRYDTVYKCIENAHLNMLQFLSEHCSERFLEILTFPVAQLGNAIESAAQKGHLSTLQFIYPYTKTRHQTMLVSAMQCRTSSALEMVQWLVEQAHFVSPPNFLRMRRQMRLDVAKYLEEKGMMNEEKKKKRIRYFLE